MAKFFGKIGFVVTEETVPGVWREVVEEREYFGDVLRNTRRWQTGEYLNDDLVISNQISIVMDAYAHNHFHSIRYVEWMGVKWKINNIDIQYPRLTLDIGGEYNGDSGPAY